MLIHIVLFKLQPSLKEADRHRFVQGLESLREIPDAEQVWIGPPAATPLRPVVFQDYDIGLTVLLRDLAAHDRYQEHPCHQQFVATFKPCWERITVIDIHAGQAG